MKPITLLKKVFFVGIFTVVLVAALYFFVFPSILEASVEEQNILIVSNKLDVNSSHIYLAHISEVRTENSLLLITAEDPVEVPHGYGEYPLQSVYQLLKIDKKDSQFIKSVFSQLIGVAIDDVVVIDSALSKVSQTQVSELFLVSAFNKFKSFEVNSALQSLLLHYRSKHMNVSELHSLEEMSKYYADIPSIFGDVYQYCSVAVVNGTMQNGRAAQIGQIIENTGGLVVRLDDIATQHETTQIYFATEPVDCSKLARNISGIFTQKPEILSMSSLDNAQQYRATVVVIVGEKAAAAE